MLNFVGNHNSLHKINRYFCVTTDMFFIKYFLFFFNIKLFQVQFIINHIIVRALSSGLSNTDKPAH